MVLLSDLFEVHLHDPQIYHSISFPHQLSIDTFIVLDHIQPRTFDKFTEPGLGEVGQFEPWVAEVGLAPILLEIVVEEFG